MNKISASKDDSPKIIPRDQHNISRKNISSNALKVLYRLNSAGYQTYLVGGGVRDLLLGKHPKDFDIATSALPEEARQEFSNGRLIGRRFRLLHVRFGREIIEVATFRGHHDEDGAQSEHSAHEDGMIMRDNVYGSLEEDAWRRDFTINALYYNIDGFNVVDYTGGLQDLADHKIRLIGDPEQRYCEDPVRMLRAVRFAAKLDFSIEENTEKPLKQLASRLSNIPPARLFEEVLKLFLGGRSVQVFRLLRQYDLFEQLFPVTEKSLRAPQGEQAIRLIEQGLKNTDERIASGKSVTPAFLFAIFLWEPIRLRVEELMEQGRTPLQAYMAAGSEIVAEQCSRVSIPRRFSQQTREIWGMQHRLLQRNGKRAFRLVMNPRFRAGYDFLLLRAQAGEQELEELGQWWTEFQEQPEKQQLTMVRSLAPHKGSKKHRRNRPRKKAAPTSG